jgi:hypothetical protein
MGRYRDLVKSKKTFICNSRTDSLCRSLDASPKLSLGIRASFELDQMLGNGELIGELGTTRDAVLDHGDEPFGG